MHIVHLSGGPCTEAAAMGLHAETLGVPRAVIILEVGNQEVLLGHSERRQGYHRAGKVG